jgi:xanthine dehydrogenase accessory factor
MSIALGDDVRARAEELRARRQPFVSATVVRAERPTSAKPGDAALVLADGSIVGFVGGACAETSVRTHALSTLQSTEPLLLHITPTDADATAEPGAVTVHNPCLSGGALDIFLEPELPPPLLVIHGDAPIARAVAGLAERLGYDVISGLEGLPADTTAVVVASHGRDEPAVLEAAVRAGVPYIGLVASRRRGEAVMEALDLTESQRALIRSPAGLDIGARTPGEVALSILAEIVSIRPRPRVDQAEKGASPSPAAPRSAVDPVCGMPVAAVDAALHVDHDGMRYWFCGSGCLQAFTADPTNFT